MINVILDVSQNPYADLRNTHFRMLKKSILRKYRFFKKVVVI